jgi:hypothetical protein
MRDQNIRVQREFKENYNNLQKKVLNSIAQIKEVCSVQFEKSEIKLEENKIR